MDNDIRTTHPSYALASFSRHQSGGPQNLFGSSIGHCNTITLTISHAELIRSEVCGDRYYPLKHIIEVEMSAAQFAEMITTMNYGGGVPVTIRNIQGQHIESVPSQSKRKQHSDEFKKRMKEFSDGMKTDQTRLQELLKKDKLSKEDKHNMKFMFEHLTTEIQSNIPFFEEMFEEQMDKTVTESKAEIDSFITNSVTKMGLEELHKRNTLKGNNAEDTQILSIE